MTHLKNSKPGDNQVTFLPKYSSTKASATLLAKRTSPAFVFVHGNDSMRDDSKVFLPILLNSSLKNSKPGDNQVTFLPEYSSTKASATLLAKRTSPAFVFVHGNDSMRDDSKVFLHVGTGGTGKPVL